MNTSPSRPTVVWVADGGPFAGLDYGVRLSHRLTDAGFSVANRDLRKCGAIEDGVTHHFVTGGETSVNDTSGWMPDGMATIRELLSRALRGESTLVGVCLGAQMIAQALWPGCVRRGKQIEVGLVEVSGLARHQTTAVSAFHFEEIDPAAVVEGGGRITAWNNHSPVQAFNYGERVKGVQFHPELSPDDMRLLIPHHGMTIQAFGGNVDEALASVDRYADEWSGRTLSDLVGTQ
jgi:GMP synthase-like glutamine amidotransferase